MADHFELSSNIYEEDLIDDNVLSLSSKCLKTIPELNNKYLTVIYLENNEIDILPEDFFPSLPNLTWLDLRDNVLTAIPKTIQNHEKLTHLLLINNKLISLPNEIGTVPNLKVLQLSGNPIEYPPFEIIKAGTARVTSFLRNNFLNDVLESPSSSSDNLEKSVFVKARSYNSVLDVLEPKSRNTMSVRFTEKDNDSDEDGYSKFGRKCLRLPKCRSKPLPHYQSSKYLKPKRLSYKFEQDEKIKQSFLRDLAVKKQKDIIAAREVILQGRRNIEQLRNWRRLYRDRQLFLPNDNIQLTAKDFPYDTNPEYMTILTRADIEKDLPDKLKRRLIRKSKPSVPRKNNEDLHLAMKIKQLFENLEAIDLNRQCMTPRSEQKAILGEIHKITEIKQKLNELSTSNFGSVSKDKSV